tara:strand:- start:200 stop:1243 length:1044 start_codon:yes stop_codon:yes gene_type:complete
MSAYAGLIPLNIVTGFLGSGKTTLLQRLLRSPRLQRTAVLVNEFGEVGLDHRLLQSVTESTLLLDNGCICCAIRGDLQEALRGLLSQRTRGEVPDFDRIVVETSGLADPVPIAYTVMAEPVLQHHLRLGAIVTTVDAVNGVAQLRDYPEAVKQVAVADRLIVTKTDLAGPADVDALHAGLRRLNRSAPILDATTESEAADSLLTDDIYDAEGKAREIAHWRDGAGHDGDALVHEHADDVHSFALTFDAPMDWTAFGIWLSMLLNRHGEHVLRVKGLLSVDGLSTPVLINGVQHIVHPPSHLEAWPDGDHRSRLIFIVRGLEQERIEASLAAFNALANAAAPPERMRL